MKKFLFLPLALLLAACGGGSEKPPAAASQASAVQENKPENKVLLNIRDIALQKQDAVEQILGKPAEDCEKGRYGLTCRYAHNGTEAEVVYINGKADWITLFNPDFLALGVPEQLGLNYEKSSFMSSDVTRYDGKFGFESLAVFTGQNDKGGESVQYVYIKAKTP